MTTPPDVEDGDMSPEQPGAGLDSDLPTRPTEPAPPSYLQLAEGDSNSAYGDGSLLIDDTESLSEHMMAYLSTLGDGTTLSETVLTGCVGSRASIYGPALN